MPFTSKHKKRIFPAQCFEICTDGVSLFKMTLLSTTVIVKDIDILMQNCKTTTWCDTCIAVLHSIV
jgi:hypothetical protein